MTDLADRAASLACWSGPVTPRPLSGGMTNANFVVEDRGARYVVRIGGDIPHHGILRRNELAASRAAAEIGVSPPVFHAGPGALVVGFIEGRTFTPEDVRDPANLPRLVDLVRRAHTEIPKALRGPAPLFWVFHVLRDYAHTLREAGSRHAAALPGLMADADRFELAVGPVDLIFGHNDLLAANVIDDGRRLWLVDWDYAGFNSPLFDLANLASNSELDGEQEAWLLSTYYGRAPDAALWQSYRAMKCASLLREAMWSMVSEIYSTIDFDYAAYTVDYMDRFARAHAAFQR